jgi:isoleucyl-tRNA synthetase
MHDYKSTVNLPKTDFPMKAGLTQREPEWLKQWNTSDLYGQIRSESAGKTKYILHDGPPYANGELHAGHVLNKVLKDFIVKSKQMAGYDAPYVPGWDCHGLPIELKVLTELGDAAKSMSKTEIRRRCRDFALRYVDSHREGFKRLGIFGQWDDPYLTLNPSYVATIIRTFGQLYEKGVVYKGLKPIHWCPSCATALAEAEVEYADKTSPSIYVKFEAVEGLSGVDGPVHFVIWTTTPWTLPANRAVTVHPSFEYSAIRANGETYVLASDLVLSATGAMGIENYEVIATFPGRELENKTYRHVFDRDLICPVILGDHVTLEAGTGCVHTAPGHGQEDYVVGARYGIPPFSPVDNHGVFTAEAGAYAGMKVWAANKQIVQDLQSSGALLNVSDYQHSYPHCWRCSGAVIFRATPQWFINLDHEGLRERLLRSIDSVSWVPNWGRERIYNMIAQRPDWCISRQRAWGVPIPVFYGKESGEIYATQESFAKVEALAASAADGIDRWFDTPANELVPDGARCAESGETDFVAETDILDVWFDSGCSSFAVCEGNPALTWPVDMYLEGSDQHRGWFQSSIIPAVALRDEPPYRSVITHGFLVDGDGRKLSKKLGNALTLDALVQEFGADVTRLWVACENYRQDVRLSKEILKQMQESYRQFRNTFRYLLSNLYDFEPEHALPFDQLLDIDQWALHQMEVLKEKVLGAYGQYEFHQVFHAAHNFCAVDMSSFYFDILKDRLYTYAADSPGRRAGQTVLSHILVDLLKLLAPVLPYTCDEAWGYLPGHLRTGTSVHLAQFPAPKPEYRLGEAALATWRQLRDVRGVVMKALEEARREKTIRGSVEAAVGLTPLDQKIAELLAAESDRLAELFIVPKVWIEPVSELAQAEEDAVRVAVEKAPGRKCTRCWNVRESVGSHSEHAEVCHRCLVQLGVVGE